MAVRVPRGGLRRSVRLAFVARSADRGRRPSSVALSLTSLIDVLVVVVVFLLLGFRAPDECLCIVWLPWLPAARNVEDLVDAPLVAVYSSGEIFVDGSPAGDTHEILESERVARVDALFNILEAKRQLFRQVRPGALPPSTVVLALDQDVPAVSVKSVVSTAAHAGFPNTSFMVKPLPR
jgi:biopolymer transport protein ExbD